MATPVPSKLPKRFHWHWRHPWRHRARFNPGFRRWLRRHGYLSPHFRVSECRDTRDHTLPNLSRARRHAWNLERFRHAIGDRPVKIISWYRTPAHNRAIGGASKSRHMSGDATDHPREWVDEIGRAKVLSAAERVFKNNGEGVYPWGALHVDSRGWRARWSSW